MALSFSINIQSSVSLFEFWITTNAEYLSKPSDVSIDRHAVHLKLKLNISIKLLMHSTSRKSNAIRWMASSLCSCACVIFVFQFIFAIISFDLCSESNWSISKCNSIDWVIHFLEFVFIFFPIFLSLSRSLFPFWCEIRLIAVILLMCLRFFPNLCQIICSITQCTVYIYNS